MNGVDAAKLNELIRGHYMVSPDVTAYYKDACTGTRVLNRMMFLACVVSHLQEMFEANPTEAQSFLKKGMFLLKYPQEFRNYVSPQCAPRSSDPKNYVVRAGEDELCRLYLKRHPRLEAEQVWVGGMTRKKYYEEYKDELSTEDIFQLEESYPPQYPLTVITYIYGDMLYPMEKLPDESLVLPPTLDRALEVIKECGEEQREAWLPNHMKWIDGYVDFSLDHNKRFAWVAD